ncbi:type II secretion system protein [Paenibacillus sp. SN-8-1]|uniref:type II secretion system protein n=1 Tax=Paenibacillus sp. SN-8-1 TaxID=3435409 RepID=UPI003D9A78F8
MKKFVSILRSKRGFTLVELLASVVLASLLASIIFSIIMFGINSYQKIQVENELRDEADLLMSSIITDMYTFGPDSVKEISGGILFEKTEMDADNNMVTVSREMHINSDGKLVFSSSGTERVLESRSKIVLPDTKIKLKCSRPDLERCRSGMIEIMLVIAQEHNGLTQQLKLESKFGF